MNITFQRKVDRLFGSIICRFLSFFPAKEKVPEGRIDRLVVILLSEMGSLVLASPMFAELKRRYPGVEIHVLLFEQNREILDIMGVVDRENVHTINAKSLPDFVRDCLKAISFLIFTKFDAVIDCELFARISAIFSFLSGARLKVGFHPYTQEGLYRGTFFNRPVLYNPYQHISHQFLTLVEALRCDDTPTVKREVPEQLTFSAPKINFPASEVQAFMAKVNEDFSAISGKKIALIYPSGGLLPIRAWPEEYYCQLAGKIIAEGIAVAIIGLKDDKAQAERMKETIGSELCINLAGYTKSLRELLALFHQAVILVTNDGGPGQFAPLTPVPAIVFYGPETPRLYGSLGERSFFFYRNMSCSPCLTAYNHRDSACNGNNMCLKNIQPDEVFSQVQKMVLDKGND